VLHAFERFAQNVFYVYIFCHCSSHHPLLHPVISAPKVSLCLLLALSSQLSRSLSFQMIVRVFADDAGEDEPLVTDVPVTPDTTCRDVSEGCRDPGDEHCALVETWGSGHGEFCGYC
jgi:hypothetical protein